MKSELFLIAEFVSVCDSKFTIVNTFDTIQSSDFPFTFRPFGIAFAIIAGTREYGKEFDLTIVLRKGARQIAPPFPVKVNFLRPKENSRVRFIGAFNWVGVRFQEPGTHVVELRGRQSVICSAELHVVKK